MNCTTYPVLPNMQKSCPKCAKHYLTIFVSPVIWGSSLPTSRTGHILYDKVRKEKYPLNELYTLVETAGTATTASLPMLEEAITNPLSEMRFWGVVGYAKLAREKQISSCPQALLALLQDSNPYIASEAAYAAAYLGKSQESVARLIIPTEEKYRKIEILFTRMLIFRSRYA